ncbi:MAG: hypothetical protein ACE5J5_08675 [Candidatus Hydrothermarchaeales archaeon]
MAERNRFFEDENKGNSFDDLANEVDSTFEALDALSEELGLDESTTMDDLTPDQILRMMEVAGGGASEFIEMAMLERQRDGVGADGKYNDPSLRENDIMLAKLGYAFDAASGSYVQKSPSDINIAELSDVGKRVLAREEEDARLRSTTDLSTSRIIERAFDYQHPWLPHSLMTEVDGAQVKDALLRYLPHAKEVRLLGFDHRVDALPEVQEAYKLAAEKGTKIKLIYHPEFVTFGTPDVDYDGFLDMIGALPNSEMCAIQPKKDTFVVESQDDGPVQSMFAGFSNQLHYSIKAVDNGLLVVMHHFIGTDKGPLTEMIESSNIPGIAKGFHSTYDQFFTGNPPCKLRVLGGSITMMPGDGHTHTFRYE